MFGFYGRLTYAVYCLLYSDKCLKSLIYQSVVWPLRGMEAKAPHFCQDGSRGFFNIDEKIGGVIVILQRGRGHGQECSFMPLSTFIALATPLVPMETIFSEQN